MCEWCVKTGTSTPRSEGFDPHSTHAPRFSVKMDKVYPQSCAQWIVMVGTTYFDKRENNSSDPKASNADKAKPQKP